ncbi:MAG: T9SS type A sorting domain-containing protein, partial [Gemmatimonadetes bacterium]|nr:T9SS type A sorting domain-containing protein [Gemmatimonadota bacterium]
SSNGLAHIRIDITYAEGTHSWHAGISQSVVVVPQADVILYDDHLIGPWHEVTATNVTIEPVQGDIVYAGSSAMAWQVNNLIVEYGTDTPVDPVGFDVLRLHVHPGTAMPGRLGAFSVLFNGDSRTVVRLLGTTGGLDINRRQWQEIDIPLRDLKLQEPIRSVRFLGDLSGKLYVDDVRFVAAGLMQQPTAVIMQATGTAKGFALDGAWPNPFNSGTVIGFRLATGAQIDLAIYDMLGQQVAQVASGWRDAGSHRASWDGRTRTGATAASGVYLYRLLCRTSSSAHTVAGKLMLLR